MQKILLITILSLITIQQTYTKHDCSNHSIINELKQEGIYRHSHFDQDLDENNEFDQKKLRRNLENQLNIAEPMRVTVDYSRINNITQYAHKSTIQDSVELAKQFAQDTFKVFPEKYTVQIKDLKWNEGYESMCTSMINKEGFSINTLDEDPGIANSDLHIYIFFLEDLGDWMVQGNACQWVNDRPLVGYMKFNLRWFFNNNNLYGDTFQYVSENVMHTMFHILGFGFDNIPFFRTKEGKKMSQSQFDSILGKETIRGKETYILKSPHVKAAVQEHFGCSTLQGAQLENDGVLGEDLAMHWEQTVFNSEIMATQVVRTDNRISKMTLAYFLDSNWYADVNLKNSEVLLWGKNRGCSFLESCDHENFPEFEDPQQTQATGCTHDRYAKSIFQQTDYSDDCYIHTMIEDNNCFNSGHLVQSEEFETYESHGENSRCFVSDLRKFGDPSPSTSRCYDQYCDEDTQELVIQFFDLSETLRCSVDSEVLEAPAGLEGLLVCPENIQEFCNFPKPCDSYCTQKGYCLWQNNKPVCNCVNGYAGVDCTSSCTALLDITGELCLDIQNCEDDEYFDGTNQCKPCHDDCTSYCNGPLSENCRPCRQDKFRKGDICVTSCGSGYFANTLTGMCEQCSSNCGSGCTSSPTHCFKQPFIDSGMTILDQFNSILLFNLFTALLFTIIIIL